MEFEFNSILEYFENGMWCHFTVCVKKQNTYNLINHAIDLSILMELKLKNLISRKYLYWLENTRITYKYWYVNNLNRPIMLKNIFKINIYSSNLLHQIYDI